MKSLSIILRIVAIVAAAAAVALFFMSKGKLADKQVALDTAHAATQATQAELETANNKITSLDAQLSTERKSLADTKSNLESIRSEMYTAKQEVTRTQQQLKESKSLITKLEKDAADVRTQLVKTEETLAKASKEAELAQLNERIEELAKANEALKQDLEAAEVIAKSKMASSARKAETAAADTGVYQTTFTPNSSPAAKPASIGAATTVASIDAQNGIIILNTAPELGLTTGSTITLIQDLTSLGKIQVTKVTPQLAIANILPGTSLSGLSQGDTVKVMH
jgi:predicted  nucleic acid-binding Zn-ribbon protein